MAKIYYHDTLWFLEKLHYTKFAKVVCTARTIYILIMPMGFSAMLPFSWKTLRGKDCRHPIALMGVAYIFGHCGLN
jgi:hypothetical protein